MKLTVGSKIKFEETDYQSPNNYLVANDIIGSSSTEYNKFILGRVDYRSFSIKYGASFSLNVFEALNIDASKLAYLYIQIYDSNSENFQKNDIKFSLSVNTVSLGKMSQYQMINVENFDGTIEIDSVTIPTLTSKAVLVIAAGEK